MIQRLFDSFMVLVVISTISGCSLFRPQVLDWSSAMGSVPWEWSPAGMRIELGEPGIDMLLGQYLEACFRSEDERLSFLSRLRRGSVLLDGEQVPPLLGSEQDWMKNPEVMSLRIFIYFYPKQGSGDLPQCDRCDPHGPYVQAYLFQDDGMVMRSPL